MVHIAAHPANALCPRNETHGEHLSMLANLIFLRQTPSPSGLESTSKRLHERQRLSEVFSPFYKNHVAAPIYLSSSSLSSSLEYVTWCIAACSVSEERYFQQVTRSRASWADSTAEHTPAKSHSHRVLLNFSRQLPSPKLISFSYLLVEYPMRFIRGLTLTLSPIFSQAL